MVIWYPTALLCQSYKPIFFILVTVCTIPSQQMNQFHFLRLSHHIYVLSHGLNIERSIRVNSTNFLRKRNEIKLNNGIMVFQLQNHAFDINYKEKNQHKYAYQEYLHMQERSGNSIQETT